MTDNAIVSRASNGTFYALYKVAGASEPSSYTATPGNTNSFVVQCCIDSKTSAPFSAVAG